MRLTVFRCRSEKMISVGLSQTGGVLQTGGGGGVIYTISALRLKRVMRVIETISGVILCWGQF